MQNISFYYPPEIFQTILLFGSKASLNDKKIVCAIYMKIVNIWVQNKYRSKLLARCEVAVFGNFALEL